MASTATYGMSFGHWMEVVEGDVRLRLGPIRREEAPLFVAVESGFGLQSYEVGRYLGAPSAPTPQDEEEWWERAQKNSDRLHWGIYLPGDEASWQLVGITSLDLGHGGRQAQSGFLLFDRRFWGRRIASTAHLARTLYAFRELDLLAITSAADVPNIASNRALTGVGYVKTGIRYCNTFVDGRAVDTIQYLLPNPADEAWRYFWRRSDGDIPAEFHTGRSLARTAMERAAAAVRFL